MGTEPSGAVRHQVPVMATLPAEGGFVGDRSATSARAATLNPGRPGSRSLVVTPATPSKGVRHSRSTKYCPWINRKTGVRAPYSRGEWPGLDQTRATPLRETSDDADVLGLFALLAGRRVELDSLTLFEGLVALALDVGKVDEHVVTLLTRDESESLFRIEKLHCALCHESLNLKKRRNDHFVPPASPAYTPAAVPGRVRPLGGEPVRGLGRGEPVVDRSTSRR